MCLEDTTQDSKHGGDTPYSWLYFDNNKSIQEIMKEFSYRIDYQYDFLKDYHDSKNTNCYTISHGFPV